MGDELVATSHRQLLPGEAEEDAFLQAGAGWFILQKIFNIPEKKNKTSVISF